MFDQINCNITMMNNVLICKSLFVAYEKAALDHVDIAINCGQLFAVLGPSGCGKTTLLKTILGKIKPTSGEVLLFGLKPNTRILKIPGPNVGFMPQEFGLINDFTVSETLDYFGKLNRMEKETIEKQSNYLLSILHLDQFRNRRIDQLSGGEQRRVSFSAAVIHQPKLLLLDEPTVGLDSELKHIVWKLIKEMTVNKNVTTIITTHYIEEARQADVVAMMRHGKMLEMDNPLVLMNKFECSTLEAVFLKLCQFNDEVTRNDIQCKTYKTNRYKSMLRLPTLVVDPNHIKILFLKNLKSMFGKLIRILLPLTLFILFCFFSATHKPSNLSVTVFNGEQPADLSQLFFDNFDKELLNVKYFQNQTEAVDEVRKGISWSAITIHPNFSSALEVRLTKPQYFTDEDANASSIKLHIDNSNFQMAMTVYWSLIETFKKFLNQLLVEQLENPLFSAIPLKEEVVYGSIDVLSSQQDFVIANLLPPIATMNPLYICSIILILEHKSGFSVRNFASGVTSVELIISHFLVMMLVNFVQVIVIMVTVFLLFQVTNYGHWIDVFGLLYLICLEGSAIGLAISALAPNEQAAFMLVGGICLPQVFFSGAIWPVEAMPTIIGQIVSVSPINIPLEAFRSVLFRGWSVDRLSVAAGYFVTFGYTVVCLIVAGWGYEI